MLCPTHEIPDTLVREVFPGEYLHKTLAEIRKLAQAGDRAARTALKLLTSNEYNK